MDKQVILKRLNRIHEIVYNPKIDYSEETVFELDDTDRELDRLLRRIEHVCKINNKLCG